MSNQDFPRLFARFTSVRGLLASLALSSGACSTQEEGNLAWHVNFACAEDGERADQVLVGIASGECPVVSVPLYQVSVERGGALVAGAPGDLPAGDYAFFAIAQDAAGRKVAEACTVVSLPASEGVDLELAGQTECIDPHANDDGGVLSGECGEPYDLMGYRDAKGFSCRDWRDYDCTRAHEEWEYSPAEEDDILTNCSKTCGVCPP